MEEPVESLLLSLIVHCHRQVEQGASPTDPAVIDPLVSVDRELAGGVAVLVQAPRQGAATDVIPLAVLLVGVEAYRNLEVLDVDAVSEVAVA